ncbi:MAG: ABC transporter permease [Christensenellales bacterium]
MKKSTIKNLKRGIPLYCLLGVAIVWYILFCYVPMAGILLAFRDFRLTDIFGGKWVGLKHFINLFNDVSFLTALKNTLILGSINMLVNFPLPIILAILLNEVKNKFFKRAAQTVSYIPHFISVVALVNILNLLIDPSTGIINRILISINGSPTYFKTDPAWFRIIYVVLWAWKEMGWGTIIYLAAISGIDPKLYEAAQVDGAGKFRRMISITFPGILPTIVIMFILAVPGIVNADFETVMLMQNIDNISVSEVLGTYIYGKSFGRFGAVGGNWAFSTAAGLFQSVLCMVIVIVANYVSRKVSEVSLW